MVNKKISKILGPVLGVMSFMLTIGVLEVPALANDNVQSNSAYSEGTNSTAYKDYSTSINKSVEQNGFKVTLDKVTATKHKLNVTIKVESEKPFDKEKADNLISEVTFEGGYDTGGVRCNDYIDENTLLINIEKDSQEEEEFPEKGELRADIVMPLYKVNVGIDADVDFSESFKNIMEKEISAKIPEFNITLNKLESDIVRTKIMYSAPYSERDDDSEDSIYYSSMILKVGDRMYKLDSRGSYSSSDEGTRGSYETEGATYQRVKDAKNISVIPVVCDISWDEMNKMYEDTNMSEYYEKQNKLKEIKNNVRYLKSFEFLNGSKGEIYNIERNDNTVKIYCKGNSEKESLLMASNMFINYEFDENDLSYSDWYDIGKYTSFYKDPKDEVGYVVEFNNVEKDKLMNLDFDFNINQIDRYKIGNEVEISK